MLILIDQDNVLADFDRGIVQAWQNLYPDTPPPTPQYFESFKFVDNLKDQDTKTKARAIYQSPGFFLNLQPVPGAIEAIKHLTELGHEVFICTSPIDRVEDCVLEKYLWVAKHLGYEWTKKIIMTKDKTLIKGDILIDDKPDITGVAEPTWTQIIYTQPYNKNITSLKRIDSWTDYESAIGLK